MKKSEGRTGTKAGMIRKRHRGSLSVELWRTVGGGWDKSKGHTQMSEVSNCWRKETLIHGSESSAETMQATYAAFSYVNGALCGVLCTEAAMQGLKKGP